ncbi:phenolic glucoside malonyltransferase 1-like [Rhododendron vialii]|uniref:phenolic glucoside malonyltransferase 1-like n=1 Tax=Rhododendron vialii TaxID=182163 RepID=UPI0026602528|nr:phenolic glucoside malonyltransferase 1-like [Rhododendron vialii]
MAPSCKLKVLEHCKISPPPGKLPSTSLPLTFFDIPWLLFPPSQPLFFFQLPALSTTHFANSILPHLKRSLSLALQHFFPLAGTLATPPHPTAPHFVYAAADSSVSLTIAESSADFHHISGHQQRDVQEFHHLVPRLLRNETASYDPYLPCPILAVQVTVFPQCGICIGFSFRHVAADGRTFDNFLKSWASIFKMEPSLNKLLLPFTDRTVIQDPNGLGPILLNQWRSLESSQLDTDNCDGADLRDMVRATFVMGRSDMEKLKQQILTRSRKIFGLESGSMYLSPYVLTCAHIWVCLTKTQFSNIKTSLGEEPHYFGFIAGGIIRLGYPVPNTYLGNCVSFGRSDATGYELVGENGIVIAAKVIGETIEKLNGDVLGGVEDWISDWKELLRSDLHVTVTGSPKVNLYGLDFGWGRPKKIEEIAIDESRAVSLTESRDVEGGIEVGLVLPRAQMNAFGSIFRKGLNSDRLE